MDERPFSQACFGSLIIRVVSWPKIIYSGCSYKTNAFDDYKVSRLSVCGERNLFSKDQYNASKTYARRRVNRRTGPVILGQQVN